VLPAKDCVPKRTTGGLSTVAVRCPDHDAAREIIRLAGVPIAAPSANISGKPSTTTAEHVRHDHDGRIDAIVDGGSCRVGVESTIIDLTEERPRLLRPGGVTPEQLFEVIGEFIIDKAVTASVAKDAVVKAPGMKYRHYAPDCKVLIIDGDMRRSTVHKYMNLSNKIGLSNVLCGYTNLDEAIQNTEHGIACLTAGEPPINPAELLMSDLMRELLELLSKHYDYIFIDSPPVPLTSDALSLADMVSGYIITVRNEVTPVEQLDKCVEALRFAGAKLLGIMLNNADGGERSYRKKRGYSYKKNYYTYDYASKDEQ
jgi:L-threonylcarbamoyladenylate synthase